MKRAILLVFMFLLMAPLLCENTYAEGDSYIANIAVLCDDTQKAKDYVKELCKYNFKRGLWSADTIKYEDKFIENESTNYENQIVLYDIADSKKYYTTFTVIDVNNKPWNFGSIIKGCVGAIILYDISDPTLQPIIESNTFYREDLKRLIKIDTPLNRCITSLQSWRCNFPFSWYNALDFVTHSMERVPEPEREKIHMRINQYTCGLESDFYDVDNKWGRGHPDISEPNLLWKINPLHWAVGEAYRCIICNGRNVQLAEPEPETLGVQNVGNVKKNNTADEEVMKPRSWLGALLCW